MYIFDFLFTHDRAWPCRPDQTISLVIWPSWYCLSYFFSNKRFFYIYRTTELHH
jgi:hypothetical protein